MNQEKIGKFIAECRKEKKMTQQELAEKLGVTDKSVGNWENGRNMPDLSLFKPLCDILGITINDLLSGEKLRKEEYQEKFEENIVNTIDYSTKKINNYGNAIGIILLVFGLFISMSAIMIFPSESSWGSIYSVFGILVFVKAIAVITRKRATRYVKRGSRYCYRLFSLISLFLMALSILIFTDYVNVKNNNEAPMFRTSSTYLGGDSELLYYDAPFYDVIKCDDDYNIIENKNYTHEELFSICENKR